MSEHNRAIFHFFFHSENTNLPKPMPRRTSKAGSVVHFCHRAAWRLVWPHQQHGPGLDQRHAAVHPGREKVVKKELWRVNLHASLPSTVRDFGKRCAVTRRSKICRPQPLILAEATPPAQLPKNLAQAKMRPLPLDYS